MIRIINGKRVPSAHILNGICCDVLNTLLKDITKTNVEFKQYTNKFTEKFEQSIIHYLNTLNETDAVIVLRYNLKQLKLTDNDIELVFSVCKVVKPIYTNIYTEAWRIYED